MKEMGQNGAECHEGVERGGWKTSRMTPLPKRGFGPPLLRYVFHPPQVSVLCFSCTKIHDRADQKLFWRGPKIFGRARSLVRFPPPIRFAPPHITAQRTVQNVPARNLCDHTDLLFVASNGKRKPTMKGKDFLSAEPLILEKELNNAQKSKRKILAPIKIKSALPPPKKPQIPPP